MEGIARGARNEAHELAVEGSGFSIDEIALLAGKTSLPIDSDIPISFKASSSFQGDGRCLTPTPGSRLDRASGVSTIPSFRRSFSTSFSPRLIGTPAAHRAIVDEAQVFSGASRCFLNGVIAPPSQDAASWSLQFEQAEPCVIGPDRAGEKPVTIASLHGDLALDPPNKILSINRLELVGPEVAAAVQGSIDWVSGAHMRLGISAGKMSAAGALAVWPNAFGRAGARLGRRPSHRRDARKLAHGGRSRRRRSAHDAAQLPPMDDRMVMDYTVRTPPSPFSTARPRLQGVNAQAIPPAARPIDATRRLHGIARPAGRSTCPAASSRCPISRPSRWRSRSPRTAGARSTSSARSCATPGFAKVVTLPLDPKTIRGQFDGDFVFRTKLPPVYDPRLASIDVNAKVDNFSAEHLVGKEKLEQGSLTRQPARRRDEYHGNGQAVRRAGDARIHARRRSARQGHDLASPWTRRRGPRPG